MKKTLIFALALLTLLSAFCGGAWAEADAASPYLGMDMQDFTVTTADGNTFTLSETLKEKELVIVNFWATWCPPCKLEFPAMESAYEQYRDKVEIIGLSIEITDTAPVLTAFAKERGVTFPLAQDENYAVSSRFAVSAVPTTVAVDRFGKVVYVGLGAMPDAGMFASLFDRFLGEGYTESRPYDGKIEMEEGRYVVVVLDDQLLPVADAIVNFCTDTACTPVKTDAFGAAVLTGDPAAYHIQVIRVPDGYAIDTTEEYVTNPACDLVIFQAQRQL